MCEEHRTGFGSLPRNHDPSAKNEATDGSRAGQRVRGVTAAEPRYVKPVEPLLRDLSA